jgi:hypothetical protein
MARHHVPRFRGGARSGAVFDPGAVEVEIVRLTKLAGEPAMAAKLRRLAAVVGTDRQKLRQGDFKTPERDLKTPDL